MKKEIRSAANFRATLTVIVLSIAITAVIRKYTK